MFNEMLAMSNNGGGNDGSGDVIESLIPVMTSNTTPSGVASCSSKYSATYEAYYAFSSAANGWDPASPGTGTEYVQYQFTNAIKAQFCNVKSSGYAFTFLVQGSKDGSNWKDLSNEISISAAGAAMISLKNVDKYQYYRFNTIGMGTYGSGIKVSLYG